MNPRPSSKPFRSARTMRVVLFSVCLTVPSLVCGQAPPKKPATTLQKPPAKPPMPQMDQMTNIPYFTLRDGMTSTLTLQNLPATPTNVTVTIFNMEGRSHVLDPMTLDPHSVKTINLQDVVPQGDFDSGNIEVAFHGISMAVTCQVSVSSVDKRVSFESREQDMMDFETAKLDGILWLPQPDAEGYLAITNIAPNKTTTQLSLGTKTEEIPLASRQTRLVKLNDEFGRHSPDPGLISLQYNGLPGDIITTGFVLNLKTGYSSGLPMTDPGIMQSSHLAGVHFRFGQPDPSEGFPAGTQFHSPLLLANVSDKPVTAHVSVDYSVEDKTPPTKTPPKGVKITPAPVPAYKVTSVPVGDLTIPPGSVQSTDLSTVLAAVDAKTVNDAGVDIDYDASPGAIIGQLTSLDQTGDYSFEVPIKDPHAMNQLMEGINPWTLENGVNTILHLKNTTDKIANASAMLSFIGGTYSLGQIELQPYETISIDLEKLQTSQKPDMRGHVLPKGATGQFVWWQETPYSLLGRSEHENVTEGIADSFSCDGNCCDYFEDDGYSYGDSSDLSGAVGGADGWYEVIHNYYDCYENYWSGPATSNNFSSENTSVANVSVVDYGYDVSYGPDAGQTQTDAYYNEVYYTLYGYPLICHGPFVSQTDDMGASALGFTAVQHSYSNNPFSVACHISRWFDTTYNGVAHHADDVGYDDGSGHYVDPSLGDPVYAMEAGTVTAAVSGVGAASYPACMNQHTSADHVTIQTSDNYYTDYYHITPTVSVNQVVNAGDEIGTVDNSGCQSKPHLHVQRRTSSGTLVNFELLACRNPLPTTVFDEGSVYDDIPN